MSHPIFFSNPGSNGTINLRVFSLTPAEAHRFVDLFAEIEDARERAALPDPMPSHGEVLRIDHPMPTREQRLAAIQRDIDHGWPFGASHVSEHRPDERLIAFGHLTYRNDYAKTGRWLREGRLSKGLQDDARFASIMAGEQLHPDQHFTGEHAPCTPSVS